MPIFIYHILHVVGIIMLFMGYGALLARSMAGVEETRIKKLGSITSGIGLLLVFIAGFAMISKMGYSFTSPWILIKLLVWFVLGGLIALINRKPALAGLLWWVLLLLGLVGATMVYWGRSAL